MSESGCSGSSVVSGSEEDDPSGTEVPVYAKIYPDEEFFDETVSSSPTRHALKCDRSRQQGPARKGASFIAYNRFAKYVLMKFMLESHKRGIEVRKGERVQGLEYFTESVLKQELSDLYGPMDEKSERYQLVFENYKEERLEQIREWIQDEEGLSAESELEATSPGEMDEECNLSPASPKLQDWFTVEEIINFDKVSIPHLVKADFFILPRPVKVEQDILDECDVPKKLLGLTGFDPDLNVPEVVIPEISDTTVGDMLASKVIDIIKDHPTGVANQPFLVEFKLRNKYYPQAKSMNYPNYAAMMTDLGKHIFLLQELRGVDAFYYPMSLQGLVLSPTKMFWNVWHKLRIAITFYQGIVKVSTALKFCENMFGWRTLDFKGWGFNGDSSFVEFLIRHSGDLDIRVIPETEFKPQGNSTVKYLVLIDEERSHYLKTNAARLKEEGKKFQKIGDPMPSSSSHSIRTFRGRQLSSSSMEQTEASEEFPLPEKAQSSATSRSKRGRKSLLSSSSVPTPTPTQPSKPQTWSSLLKK
jgi:hypothetical protein